MTITSLTIVLMPGENSNFVHGVPFNVWQDFSRVMLVSLNELSTESSIHLHCGIAATNTSTVELQQVIVFIK